MMGKKKADAQEAAQLAHNVELNRQCVEQTWRRLEQVVAGGAWSKALCMGR